MSSWKRLLIAAIVGILVGLLIRYIAPEDQRMSYAQYLKPIGDLFMHLIKMLIVPLIFASIASAIVSMKDVSSMGRMGGKSFAIYLITTVFAGISGIFFALLTGIGKNIESLDLSKNSDKAAKVLSSGESLDIVETLINVFPTNPAAALSNGNSLQIIIFAIFLGIAINLSGKKGERLGEVVNSLADVMYSLTDIVMKFAPYGVFGLVGFLVATQDSTVLHAVIKLIVVGYVAYIIHAILIYGSLLTFVGKVNFFTFIKKLFPAQLIAYTTSSSAATLPVTMSVAQNKMGVSKSTADFVLPLGTTVNMDGTSMTIGLYSLFLAGIYGIDLGFSQYLIIVSLASLVSIGAAGIPSASLVMLSVVLSAIGVPIEGVAIIIAFDRILDMARTVVNVTGDATVAVLVDKSEGRFDQKKFDS